MQHSVSVTNKYDPNLIIQAAREIATGSGINNTSSSNDGLAAAAAEDIGRGQMIYQQALLDWTDDYREGVVTDPNEIEILQEAITSLWISYAQFLMNAKQYKTATETFEQALLEWPAATKLYLEYARFAEERQKVKTAQDIYLRALVQNGTGNILDEQDRNLLWNEFLQMMQNKNPELTLEELQHAVEENAVSKQQQQSTDETDDNLDEERETKRFKNDPDDDNDVVMIISNDPLSNLDKSVTTTTIVTDASNKKSTTTTVSTTAATSKTHVVLADSIEHEALGLLKQWTRGHYDKKDNIPVQQLLPGDVMAAWMILDGNEAPTIPEPLLFQSTTPKLTDPTGKDIVGIDVAIQLIERLLDPLSGDLIFEICSALWTIQGLKFVETNDILDKYDTTTLQEYEQLETILESRLASSTSNPTLVAAVQQMNHNERQNFQSTVSNKRIQLLTKIAWEFRYILYLQQTILRQLKVPGFNTDDDDDNNNNNNTSKQQLSGATAVDTKALQIQANICKYLHSAFYIRSRMGKESHESTLRNQLKRLQKEQIQQQQHSSLSPKMQSVSNQPNSPMPMYTNTTTAYGAPSLPQQQTIETGPPQYLLQPQIGVVGAAAIDYSRQPPPPLSYGAVPPPTHLPLPPPPPPSTGYGYPGGYTVPPSQQQYYYPQQQQQPPLMMQQPQPPQPYIPGYVVPGQPPVLYQQPPPPNNPQQQQQPQYPYYQQQ